MIEKSKNWNKSTFDTTIAQHHLLTARHKKWKIFFVDPLFRPMCLNAGIRSHEQTHWASILNTLALDRDLLVETFCWEKSCVFVQTWIKPWWLEGFKWKFLMISYFGIWIFLQETTRWSSRHRLVFKPWQLLILFVNNIFMRPSFVYQDV